MNGYEEFQNSTNFHKCCSSEPKAAAIALTSKPAPNATAIALTLQSAVSLNCSVEDLLLESDKNQSN